MSQPSLSNLDYCASRFQATRRESRIIQVGNVAIGGDNPVRIQSMTTTNTQDIDATVAQTLALAEAGCEIVRITAPNKAAAKALGEISKQLRAAKCDVPLVADIHFLPAAAMEAALHVEKVRINPGNYADKKKFAVLEYTDAAYAEELERLHEAFTPIVLRCKELGRAMRIGTNHGSLADRLMNRYGDSPLGMVESALEFIRIAESHNYHDICLSMKASNPKVMIEAYRLAAARMAEEGMNYPLHLGVTEAGDGEDARVKSAIGIGTLLNDGLGDTIRVSLTEDPIYEVPVARDLADKAMALWKQNADTPILEPNKDSIDPFDYRRRNTRVIELGPNCRIGGELAPAVIIKAAHPLSAANEIIQDVCRTQTSLKESKLEGLQITINNREELAAFTGLHEALHSVVQVFVLELSENIDITHLEAYEWPEDGLAGITLLQLIEQEDAFYASNLLQFCRGKGFNCAIDCQADALRDEIGAQLAPMGSERLILTSGGRACLSSASESPNHPVGSYRALAEAAQAFVPDVPIWIRNTQTNTLAPKDYFADRLLECSILSGALLCDGIGDAISIETEPLLEKATTLAYNILQGARARITKTEFVACPSCGRTLFDLQSVTQTIRARTDHLKGVTIAIMGCIVNGPGEMADADFGYVGGAPDKINLYVGKECVKYNVPAEEALDRLIDLIKEHDKWVDAS
ncbi:MAG: (E)-4-hydroxy-3-methylbut-2-enyl-diphosphate synthase [Opitutae bacterium]|jgi:(E)-4-hydroxy-3-methylbut-2-enyl-diphosphate synthase|nr:(E)-4-hydroxy-3-methylbut-2-enyl-diphosphate synthase [Opitutae bacterium]